MKRVKAAFMFFLIFCSIFLAAFSFTKLEARGAEQVLFEDDFEGYSVGTFPSSGGWELWFDGEGPEHQVILQNVSQSPTKSLKLLGVDFWAAFAAKRFTSSSPRIGFEVAVRVADANGGSRDNARIAFTKKVSGAISCEYAPVTFQDSGTINSGGQVLQSYVADRWYKIKLIMDRDSDTYSVWVDGELKGENLTVTTTSGSITSNPTSGIEAFSVSQCYNSVTAYFDDVKIFSFFDVNPRLELVPSTGIAATTLVGSGFTPNSEISVTWDGATIPTVPSPLFTDDHGYFTGIISVLTQTEGAYTVRAVDEMGNAATATFTVTQGFSGQNQLVVPDDYPTIQEAINHAAEGATIIVKAGTYYENVVVTKSISLRGESSGNTIIDGGGGTSLVVYVDNVDNVEISGFKIQNGYDGIYLYNSSDVTVSGNTITNCSFRGIILSVSSSNTISGNTLTSNYDGIELYKSSHVTVSENTIKNSRFGIAMSRSPSNTFSENTLTNNTDGIYIWNSTYATISGNTIANSANNGISFIISSNSTFSGNTITSSAVSGISLSNSSNCYVSENNLRENIQIGLRITYSTSATIVKNEIVGNHNPEYLGATGLVVFHCTNSEVSENQIAENDNGAVISNSQSINFYNNNVTNNGFHGLNIVNGNGHRIFGNTMRNNTNGICPSGGTNTQIYENTLQENEYGIAVYGASNNFIYHNYFIDNLIQANNFHGQETNSWDNGIQSGGNYWKDYTGEDSDGEGIGDTPYIIDGNNRDNFPLMNPSPPPFIAYKLIVDSNPMGVTFTADSASYTTPWSITYNETTSVSLEMPESCSFKDEDYIWWRWSDGNTNQKRTVTVNKNTALTAMYRPEDTSLKISVLSPENKTYATTEVPLEITVNRIFFGTSYSLDGQANVTTIGNTTLTGLSDGSHNIIVYIEDAPGNVSASDIVHFTVDTIPPDIKDVSQMPIENNGTTGETHVNATVTDAVSGVEWVALNYTDGNGTWVISEMANLEEDIWNGTIPAFPHGTNVTYIIIARDKAQNTITSEDLSGYPNEYEVLPELLPWIILPLFLTSLFAVAIRKRIFTPAP